MRRIFNRYRTFFIYLCLALVTIVTFESVRQNQFVNYDDPDYVYRNPNVQSGVTLSSIKWAFTTGHAANWHPLTWLSHMLDWQLFGDNPGWHHLTNLFLHIANTLLLFAVLKRMTNALDVLSTLFWMLTIAAYLRYLERPGTGRYLLTLLIFALGLMAKPMLVTLPFVLLLLDYWPLGRFQFGQIVKSVGQQSRKSLNAFSHWKLSRHLLLEKVPLFALSAISSIVTFLVQRTAGAVTSVETLPLKLRIANTFVSYLNFVSPIPLFLT
jgi:hypothetical protein